MQEAKSDLKDIETGTVLDEDFQAFRLATGMEVISKKDENGDYSKLMFRVKDKDGNDLDFFASRDEMAAVTFALARQDQQAKLLNSNFRKYKEVPVRLVIRALKDIKAGDFVVTYRKERVPVDEFNYEYRA